MPLPSVSVLTIARGRAGHLRNLVLGLARQTHPPVELLIAAMQPEPYADLPETGFPIRQIHVVAEELPLARARNEAARAARGEILVFLDVDCIPAPGLVADYAAATRRGEGLTMGEVLYLPAGATEGGWTAEGLGRIAVRHSDRQAGPATGRRACADYRCFWSLTFGMHRDDWAASGGFDERFVGYGGEDTDFGRGLAERGVPLWWIAGARAFHQHHPHCMPPIHHLRSIVRNAELFAEKWGHRTMGHWLHGFRMMGLIAPSSTGLRILREPGPEDFALCEQTSDMPYAATGRVIRILEDRVRRAAGLPPEALDAGARHARMTRAEEDLLSPARPFAAQ